MSKARYDYRCDDCQTVIEIQKRMSDPAPRTHEGCGGKLVRLWTAPKVAFVGGGFYINGNRS